MKIDEIICKIETETDVSSIRINYRNNSFQIYPWLKAKLFYKKALGTENLASRNLQMLWKQIISFFYGIHNILRRYDAWALSNSQERIQIKGKYFDKLFDSINEIENFKLLLIELQLFKKYKRKENASKYIISKAFFMIQEELYSKLFLRRLKIEHEELIEKLTATLDVKVDTKSIVRKSLAQYAVMRLWLKILPNPKLIFVTVGYSNFGYILAFKEKKIPVIELQHGVISEGHQAYNYKIALDKNNFPDVLAVWSASEKNSITKNSKIPIDEIFILGRSIIDHYSKYSKTNERVKEICVSLQDGGIGEKMIDSLLKLDEMGPGKFIFKLQRRRTSEIEYRTHFDFPINFYFFDGNIYENIVSSDVHITVYSTSAIESLVLGKTNVFLDDSGKAREVFEKNISDNPYCFYLDNHVALNTFLTTYSPESPEKIMDASINLNALNYMNNLRTLIRKYIGEK